MLSDFRLARIRSIVRYCAARVDYEAAEMEALWLSVRLAGCVAAILLAVGNATGVLVGADKMAG